MRTLLLASVLAAAAIAIAAPRPASACSIVNDEAQAPEPELGYDAAESPPPPKIVEARITHHDDGGPGCVTSSCGSFSGLSLTLTVAPGVTLVRIDFSDRPHVYAHVWDDQGGQRYIFLPGYGDDDVLDLSISAIDSRGYTSQPVSGRVFSDQAGDDGCSASGSQSSALLVLFAILLVLLHRRGEL